MYLKHYGCLKTGSKLVWTKKKFEQSRGTVILPVSTTRLLVLICLSACDMEA
jgi:hypothetical protein